MGWKEWQTWKKGAFTGLIVLILLLFLVWGIRANSDYQNSKERYNNYLNCEQCGSSLDLDCVMKICPNSSIDVGGGIFLKLDKLQCELALNNTGEEKFINAICPPREKIEKPSIISILFSSRVFFDIFSAILILIIPFMLAGALVGFGLEKTKNWPCWLKGGLLGLIYGLYSVLFFIPIASLMPTGGSSPAFANVLMFTILPLEFLAGISDFLTIPRSGMISTLIAFSILLFIFGVIIGWIIGKIRGK